MNCFRLPLALIRELHQLMARFWWNGASKDRRIHWVSWERMCLPKCLGGLGFRNLESFNLFLLAKQGWHLLHNPSCILQFRYFRSGSFLNATQGGRPSFIWRSLLRQGLRWRIESGSTIDIYGSNWLPRVSSFQVRSFPSLPLDSKVNSLFSSDGSWDVERIHSHFDPDEARLILSLPIGKDGSPDQLI